MAKKSKDEKELRKKDQIVVWNPNEYAREMDRVFSDFEHRMERVFPGSMGGSFLLPRWRPIEFPEVRRPVADLIDSGSEYRVRAEIPGIPKEKLDISVTPRGMTISGEAESDVNENKEGFVHRERTYSKIRREINFPEDVIADKADATVKNGILEVRVPKKIPSESKTHKLQVK